MLSVYDSRLTITPCMPQASMTPMILPLSVLGAPPSSLTTVSEFSPLNCFQLAGHHLIERLPVSPAYDDFAHSDTGDHPIEPSNSPAHVNGTPKHLYATVDGVAKVKLSGDLAVSRLVHAKRDDKFPGCTRREKGWIRAAGSVAHILITEAYEYVKHIPDVPAPENLPARYITWFGPYRFGRRLVVQGSLGLMSAEDQFTRLTYHCLRACRDKRWGAYVSAYTFQRRDCYSVADRPLNQGRAIP